MFGAGSNLKGKSDEEIFYQDFKRFTSGKIAIGVGQITSLNGDELESIRPRVIHYMENARQENSLDLVFFHADKYFNRIDRPDLRRKRSAAAGGKGLSYRAG